MILKVIRSIRIIRATLVTALLSTSLMATSQSSLFEINTQTIINRLDTTVIATIVSNPSDLTKSASELLVYYKNRTSVKHPIQNAGGDITISDKELKYANDALKHIFVGQPAYPSYHCGENINWNSRPVPDKEWVWQLNRMYFWNAMGKTYSKTKDERYAEEWCAQIVDWIQKNPRDESHKHAWRSIEAGIRGHSWTNLYNQFINSEHFTAEVLVAFMNSCYEHAEYLMTKYRSGSNWALMEAEGMAFIAFTFPEFSNSKKWKSEAIRRLNIEMNKQVYADGQQRELAMGYHIGSIRWFYRTYELAVLNDAVDAFPKSFIDKLEKMCEVPMMLCLPDGTNAQFGDSWAGEPGQYRNKFEEWAGLFDRKDFLYFASEGKQGNAPNRTAFALEESGLYSIRSGWDKSDIALVLKCGPDGGGHCQPDNGTFTLYAGGRTLMPDGGSYIYSGDPEGRAWFRQSRVHQTLTLNEKNTTYAPKLVKWEEGDNLDILIVENAGYENLTHRRSIFFVDKRYFVIVDEAIGSDIGQIDLNFQLAPGDAIFNQEDLSVRTDFSNGWNVMIKTSKHNGIQLHEEEGWVSFIYTKKQPRPAFRYSLEKTSKEELIQFVTVVAPYENEIPNITARLGMNDHAISNKMQVIIQENGVEKILNYKL